MKLIKILGIESRNIRMSVSYNCQICWTQGIGGKYHILKTYLKEALEKTDAIINSIFFFFYFRYHNFHYMIRYFMYFPSEIFSP